jgi:hypothetical protein
VEVAEEEQVEEVVEVQLVDLLLEVEVVVVEAEDD